MLGMLTIVLEKANSHWVLKLSEKRHSALQPLGRNSNPENSTAMRCSFPRRPKLWFHYICFAVHVWVPWTTFEEMASANTSSRVLNSSFLGRSDQVLFTFNKRYNIEKPGNEFRRYFHFHGKKDEHLKLSDLCKEPWSWSRYHKPTSQNNWNLFSPVGEREGNKRQEIMKGKGKGTREMDQ